MNTKYLVNIAGKIVFFTGLMLLLPLGVALLFGETELLLPYALLSIGMLAVGSLAFIFKPKNTELRTREGLVIAGISWMIVSLLGALPLWITGDIPNFLDALFEVVSGFTTTGATILNEIETLSHAALFWRAFTHWVGGMGVLVFVLALLPATDPQSMHIMRAEMPGPTVGKIVAKTKLTARLLYVIYLVFTAAECVFLLCGGMPLFDSVLTSFATAGTGGFSVRNAGIAAYDSAYVDVVITVFMLLFSINFNLYFLILAGNIKDALKSEELHWFGTIVLLSVGAITLNTFLSGIYNTFGESLRRASFQVASFMSSTGFVTADYNGWPALSRAILVMLMFIGACAGSTGGGIKVSRVIVLCKTALARVKKQISPNSVIPIKLEGKIVEADTRHGITAYLFAFVLLFAVSLLVMTTNTSFDLTTDFTSVLSCLNNIGPYFSEQIDPATGSLVSGLSLNFASFNPASKVMLIFDMLAGRLEIFPMLTVFYPFAWKKRR